MVDVKRPYQRSRCGGGGISPSTSDEVMSMIIPEDMQRRINGRIVIPTLAARQRHEQIIIQHEQPPPHPTKQ